MTMTAMERAQKMTGGGKSMFGYYRQPNGWITVSPMADLDQLKYMRKGWEPLNQYGFLEMTSEYAADHPFEVLFMFGGAKELPVDQIIEMAFHLNPPLIPSCGLRLGRTHKRHNAECFQGAKEVVFPQLDEAPEGFQCRFCDRAPFPSDRARDQHESVMHKEEKSDIRTGTVLAESIVSGLKGDVPEAPHEERLLYACGLCPKSYRYVGHLKRHIKEAHS